MAQAGPSALSRLQVLSHHLVGSGTAQQQLARAETRSADAAADEAVRPAPGGGAGTLTVLDNRTGKRYTVRMKSARHAQTPWTVRRGGRGVTTAVLRAAAAVLLPTRALRPAALNLVPSCCCCHCCCYNSWRSLRAAPSMPRRSRKLQQAGTASACARTTRGEFMTRKAVCAVCTQHAVLAGPCNGRCCRLRRSWSAAAGRP